MNCENCQNIHDGEYGSGRFCSSVCARGFATKAKRTEINEKVSSKLKGRETGRTISPDQRAKMQEGQQAYFQHKPAVERKTKSTSVFSHKSHPQWLIDFIPQLLPVDRSINRDSYIKRAVLQQQNSRCNKCNLNEWLGQALVLELEHKDGDNTNNERDNLECLCPNCHSQTPTWRGRNKARKVSDEEMIAVLRETKSMHRTLLHFGMAPKGGNYKRTKRLVEENNIDISRPLLKTRAQLLTPQNVIDIRMARDEGESIQTLANRFGVSRKTIANCVNRIFYDD